MLISHFQHVLISHFHHVNISLYLISPDDDLWEYVDLDAEANTGDIIEYKMSVLLGDKWIDTDWTTGEWGRSQVCYLVVCPIF